MVALMLISLINNRSIVSTCFSIIFASPSSSFWKEGSLIFFFSLTVFKILQGWGLGSSGRAPV
jgi:hypothetical protein